METQFKFQFVIYKSKKCTNTSYTSQTPKMYDNLLLIVSSYYIKLISC